MNAEQEFEAELAERSGDEPSLMVDVEGFEGPLDLLLTLARQQKVDLAKISILALADQYLAFIEEARKMRLELAADYLVMAAWLAYLKSRLLLPEQHPAEGLSAEDMANALATLYDLLSAYSSRRQIQSRSVVRVAKRTVWSLAEAREALERLIGQSMDWSPLDQYLIAYLTDPAMTATVLASSFAAALEMIREGRLEAHQQGAFSPLYLRKKRNADGALSQDGAAESGNG